MSLTLPQVSPFGEEFGYVEHQLRLQLNAPSLELIDLFDIGLKPVNSQFNNYVKNHDPANVVDVFLPTVGLKQSKSDIVSHGIKVHPNDGFTFQTDTVELNKSGEFNEVIHIQVALGRVINHQDIKSAMDKVQYLTQAPTVSNLQEGYESIRIGDNKFVVFNPGQVRALHVCKFEYKEGISDKEPCATICDMCGKHNATIYCQNDAKKLCVDCDKSGHNNEFTKDHKREDLKAALPFVQKCPEHPHCNVMYYCMKCHRPICMDCKVKGSHAHGEFAKHKLIPIEKAYSDAMGILRHPLPFFDQRNRIIDDELEATKEKLEEIRMNQKSVEDEIMRIAMKAIEDSRVQNARVANIVKSKQLELLRKKDELKRQRFLLDSYKQNAEPVPLLETVYRNMKLEETMAGNKDLPQDISVEGNLIVYGRIEISPPKIEKPQEKKPVNRDLNQSQSTPYSYTYTESEAQSTVLEPKDPHYTKLTKMAQRKQSKYDQNGISVEFVPFADSKIITDGTLRNRLYMCFPFKGVPEPHMLFSSEEHGKNIRLMHKMIDNMGITCILIKSGDQVFGGFAASKWTADGTKKTDKSSTFLFSITKDAFIPYGGQSDEKFYTMSTPETLNFGGKDLVIAGESFERCSSELENSFGIGFLYGSQKAKEFLAGKHRFAADQIEVWGFFTSD